MCEGILGNYPVDYVRVRHLSLDSRASGWGSPQPASRHRQENLKLELLTAWSILISICLLWSIIPKEPCANHRSCV